MSYTNFQVDIKEKYKIDVVWPGNIPMQNPSKFNNYDDLNTIAEAFMTGTAYFRPLTKAERRGLETEVKEREAAGVVFKKKRATRSDKGGKHGPTGKRKAKGTGDKENMSTRKRARADVLGEGSRTVYKSSAIVDDSSSDEDEDEEEDIEE